MISEKIQLYTYENWSVDFVVEGNRYLQIDFRWGKGATLRILLKSRGSKEIVGVQVISSYWEYRRSKN